MTKKWEEKKNEGTQDSNELLKKYEDALKQSKLRVRDLAASCSSYKAANTRARKEIAKCLQAISDAKVTVESLQDELKMAQNDIKEANELIKQQSSRISVLEEAIDDLTNQRADALKAYKAANDELVAVTKKLDNTKKLLVVTKDALEVANERIDEKNLKIKLLSDENAALVARILSHNRLPWIVRIFKPLNTKVLVKG